jgi:hypothetical protein
MALIVSAATGNFNAGATWVGGVVPTIGDEAQASNGHTITITANANCNLVSNTGTGIFTLNDGVTLTANVTNKSTTTNRNCVQFTANSPAIGYIIGNCTGGTTTTSNGANNTGTGTLNVTGNSISSTGAASFGVNNSGTGTINITGNVIAGSGANAHGAYITNGTMNITGNITGGSITSGFGVRLEGAGTLNITGNVFGGTVGGGVSNFSSNGFVNIIGNVTAGAGASSIGVVNELTSLITINGICTGGTTNGAPGVRNASTGTVRLTRAVGNAYGPGNTAGLAAAVGAANVGLGVIEIEQLEYGTNGMSPTSGTGIRLKKLGSNVAVFNFCDTAGSKTLIDATQNAAMPAASNVRSGVSYAGGAATGTLAVPLPSQVAVGVATDNTVGTAFVTGSDIATAVWGAATRSITGGTVDTLTNAPASVTPSDIWSHSARTLTSASGPTATEIRQEMDSNSTQLSAIKSKTDNLPADPADQSLLEAAIAGVTAPTAGQVASQVRTELSSELAKVAALNTERLANVATTAIVGNLIAQANS